MAFKRVAKSVGVSEDAMRGHPLGDSAAVRFDGENFWRSTGDWNDSVVAWTRKRVLPHTTSTLPSSR